MTNVVMTTAFQRAFLLKELNDATGSLMAAVIHDVDRALDRIAILEKENSYLQKQLNKKRTTK